MRRVPGGDTPTAVLASEVARLSRELADLRSTTLARVPGRKDTLFLPASRFDIVVGSPALGSVGSWPVWLLDASADEAVAATFEASEIPGWGSYYAELWWANAGTGAGNVTFWLGAADPRGEGDALNLNRNHTTIHAAGAQAVLVRSLTDATAGEQAAPTMAEPFGYHRVRRIGGDGSDTLTNDIGLVGLRLLRVS